MPRHDQRNDLDLVKQGLQDRIVEVCANLLPRGRREGKDWVSHNPHVDEARKSPALKVALSGPNRGAWRDWRNGDKGDVIKLIEFCLSCSFKEAMDWSRDFLGMERMSYEERKKLRELAETRKQRAAIEDEERRARKIERAQKLFFDQTHETGFMAGAEIHARRYFQERQCALEGVKHLSQKTFRFSAATEYWKGAVWSKGDFGGGRKVQSGPSYPAIHTGMRVLAGTVSCCHVTFLDPVRPKKAPLDPPKLMFGEALGAVIEIAMGPGDKDFWDAEATPGPLILCEGIETGLSIAAAIDGEARVWAGGSLAGMGHAPVRLPCVSEIHVARDNNAGNRQAQQQLAQALARLEGADKPINIMQSHVGDDFNDLMTGNEDG
jgi:hypothetical protein